MNLNFRISDESGNELISINGNLTLNLVSESRKIGQFLLSSGRVIYNKFVDEKVHTFRKNNSWGINWCVIEQLKDDDVIRVQSDERIYVIKVSDAKNSGSFLWFKDIGFEKQFFIPKSYFKTKEV